MKRTIAKIKVNFLKDGLYSGEDTDCFMSKLKDFVEKESKGYVYASFEVVEE